MALYVGIYVTMIGSVTFPIYFSYKFHFLYGTFPISYISYNILPIITFPIRHTSYNYTSYKVTFPIRLHFL